MAAENLEPSEVATHNPEVRHLAVVAHIGALAKDGEPILLQQTTSHNSSIDGLGGATSVLSSAGTKASYMDHFVPLSPNR